VNVREGSGRKIRKDRKTIMREKILKKRKKEVKEKTIEVRKVEEKNVKKGNSEDRAEVEEE